MYMYMYTLDVLRLQVKHDDAILHAREHPLDIL